MKQRIIFSLSRVFILYAAVQVGVLLASQFYNINDSLLIYPTIVYLGFLLGYVYCSNSWATQAEEELEKLREQSKEVHKRVTALKEIREETLKLIKERYALSTTKKDPQASS